MRLHGNGILCGCKRRMGCYFEPIDRIGSAGPAEIGIVENSFSWEIF